MQRTTSRYVLSLVALWCMTTAALTPGVAIAADQESTEPTGQPAAQAWGHLSGRFVYDGTPPEVEVIPLRAALRGQLPDESLVVNANNRGIADIFIFLVKKKSDRLKVHPAYEETAHDVVDITIPGQRFDPHAQLVRVGQTLQVRNRDNVDHNVNLALMKNTPVNKLLKPGAVMTMQLTKAERLPASLKDDMYPWMSGKLLVMDHPYMAKTDIDGRFTIKNLPVGSHKVRLWHEESGYLKEIRFGDAKQITNVKRGALEVTIKPGENNLGELHLAPSLFER